MEALQAQQPDRAPSVITHKPFLPHQNRAGCMQQEVFLLQHVKTHPPHTQVTSGVPVFLPMSSPAKGESAGICRLVQGTRENPSRGTKVTQSKQAIKYLLPVLRHMGSNNINFRAVNFPPRNSSSQAASFTFQPSIYPISQQSS